MEATPLRTLMIGQGSFIASACGWDRLAGFELTKVGHGDWRHLDLSDFDVVVNFAFDPRLMKAEYCQDFDIDREIALACAVRRCHFVMISSRQVYSKPPPIPASEQAPCVPENFYGANKLRIEGAVAEILGPGCTIVRVANVFGMEPGRHTFFGQALKSLRDSGRITLDINPFVERDFIAVEDCADLLGRIVVSRPSGIVNLGRGEATAVGRVALWLIEGYGEGELLVTSPRHWDAFQLDVSRLVATIGDLGFKSTVRQQCISIGERLRKCGRS